MGLVIGLDVGGTHVDGVIVNEREILYKVKFPIEDGELSEAIWATLSELIKIARGDKLSRINLSTTIATNAIVEGKLEPVGMVIESGPGIDPSLFSCGDEIFFLSGYIDHRGVEVKRFEENEIYKAKEAFLKRGIKVCGVVSKFSVRNPSHEIQAEKILNGSFQFISLGHKLSGKLNFPRRVHTVYLNSATYTSFKRFYQGISEALEREKIRSEVNILKADGGTMEFERAKEYPVYTILSGPAASILGALALEIPQKDGILLDIGGTTTDVSFVAEGVPLLEPFGIEIGRYKSLVRALYSFSIGLGGDSKIEIRDGKIKIGPEREGPPRALGGPYPTPSDAMITLGMLDFGNRLRASEAIREIAIKLGVGIEECAKAILKEMITSIKNSVEKALENINNRPVTTIKELLYGKKIKPEFISLIGGPAKALSPLVESEFKIPCYLPKHYEVANAVGAAFAKKTLEITLFANTADGVLTVPELGIYEKIGRNFDLRDAQERALKLLRDWALSEGIPKEELECELSESTSFNIVRGFYTYGKSIRVRAQIKPGVRSLS